MPLEFLTSADREVTVVELAGRLDNLTAAEFDGQFRDLNATQVVLDLARLDYISSAGLRCVLGALKRLKSAGGSLAIAGGTPSVVEVFDISGFRSLVPMHTDRAAAMAALG